MNRGAIIDCAAVRFSLLLGGSTKPEENKADYTEAYGSCPILGVEYVQVETCHQKSDSHSYHLSDNKAQTRYQQYLKEPRQ